jgi:hypothetical protein
VVDEVAGLLVTAHLDAWVGDEQQHHTGLLMPLPLLLSMGGRSACPLLRLPSCSIAGHVHVHVPNNNGLDTRVLGDCILQHAQHAVVLVTWCWVCPCRM